MEPQPTVAPAIRALLEQAIGDHRAGRLAQAEQGYKRVLHAAPQEPDASHNLGLIALQAGQREAALALFQTALAANARQPQYIASLAHTLLELGRNEDALSVLQRALQDGVRSQAIDALRNRAHAGPKPSRPQREEEAGLYQLFNLGRHAELQREARRLLEQFPETGYLWKFLGASLQVEGRDPAGALQALRKAAALLPNESDAQNNLAVALLARGEFDEAANYARRALQIAPQLAEAMRNLGASLHGLRDFARATEYFRQVLVQRSDPATRMLFALCLGELGRHAEALEQLRSAAQEGCDTADLHFQTGIALQATGQAGEAELSYRRALKRDPGLAIAGNNLGNILQARGDLEQAVSCYRSAIGIRPGYADAHNNLGVALRELGRQSEAVACFKRALGIREEFVEAHSNLGNVLQEMGRLDEALTHCRRAIAIDPLFAEAHGNLGHALHMARQYDQALASLRQAVALNPGFADAHANIGAVYRDLGQPKQAFEACLEALRQNPDHLAAHSGLLISSTFMVDGGGPAMLEHARRYGAAAARRARPYTDWPNTPDPLRRLRIGFVSADLHRHPVGFFLDSVLAALHASCDASLELFIYDNGTRPDDLTDKLRGHVSTWRSVFGMPDKALAGRIREDGIDILFDLSGHTTGTRLAMFANKPAPVQASWLGYFATTGLAAMDYFVADPRTLPLEAEVRFTETIWRLPETRLCFSAPDVRIAIGPLPALANGYVTLGCCNNLGKLGDEVIASWAGILHAIPNSRLLLKSKQLGEAARIAETHARFAAYGIRADRLLLEGPSRRADYLHTYSRIDFALDPFPYTGGTVTAEALWMGVPVLTLEGECFIARQGAGMLASAGLPDWVAADTNDYLAKAVALANDLTALAGLRSGLRARVLASPLFDAPRFAGHFSTMLRDMWRTWCEQEARR
ncbi:MAG TPA: tetratricopeptide repeat protein [Burkholderiaceae bacterium]